MNHSGVVIVPPIIYEVDAETADKLKNTIFILSIYCRNLSEFTLRLTEMVSDRTIFPSKWRLSHGLIGLDHARV